MSNKKLIQQYVTTGIILPEEQFDKLGRSFKRSYLRSRINGYHYEDNPLYEYELDSIKLAPEESIKVLLDKIPEYGLGTLYYLKTNGGLNIDMPDTTFDLIIHFYNVDEFVKSNMSHETINDILVGEFTDWGWNSEEYKYAPYNDENSEFIKKHIELVTDGDIVSDDVSEALNEYYDEYGGDDEIFNMINDSAYQASQDELYKEVKNSLIRELEDWGDVTVDFDAEYFLIKTDFHKIVDVTEYYPHELDEHIYNQVTLDGDFTYADVIYELIRNGKIDKLNVNINTDIYYDDENFNEILKNRLEEL